MYEIVVNQHFDAAHFLRGYKGKCENIHGHRYSVVVRLKAKKLNEIGLAYDFTDVKKYLREIIGGLDHNLMNELPYFKEINPSAENIASTIYRELNTSITEGDVIISAVEVWETPEQGVVYTPD